jgi:hypothetical protein
MMDFKQALEALRAGGKLELINQVGNYNNYWYEIDGKEVSRQAGAKIIRVFKAVQVSYKLTSFEHRATLKVNI